MPYDEESDRDDLLDRRWTSASRVRHIRFGRASARPPVCAPVRSLYETFDLTEQLLCGHFIRGGEEALFLAMCDETTDIRYADAIALLLQLSLRPSTAPFPIPQRK